MTSGARTRPEDGRPGREGGGSGEEGTKAREYARAAGTECFFFITDSAEPLQE